MERLLGRQTHNRNHQSRNRRLKLLWVVCAGTYVDIRGQLQVSVLAICFDTAALLAQDCTHLADKPMSSQGGKFLSLLPISTRSPGITDTCSCGQH